MYSDWRCKRCGVCLEFLDVRSGACRVCGSFLWRKWQPVYAWRDLDTGRWAIDEPPTLFSERMSEARVFPAIGLTSPYRRVFLLDTEHLPPVYDDTETPSMDHCVEFLYLTIGRMRWPGEVVHGRVVLEYERQEMEESWESDP